MSTVHRLNVTIDHMLGVRHEFQCDSDIGATCRLVCEADCEEFDPAEHQHQLVDSGECNLVLFANADDSELCERMTTAGTVHFRSGPVLLTYAGDGLVEWCYDSAS